MFSKESFQNKSSVQPFLKEKGLSAEYCILPVDNKKYPNNILFIIHWKIKYLKYQLGYLEFKNLERL